VSAQEQLCYDFLYPVQQQRAVIITGLTGGSMSDTPSTPPQNFDEWAHLARSNPQAFEAQRIQVINRAIQQAPAHKQHRLRCMQWQLDQIRNTSRTPMVACLRMNRMRWESVAGEQGLLACLNRPDGIRLPARPRMKTSGSPVVIPFQRKA
jgi:hypothetical protein